jgi:exonuclease SbcC
VIRRPEQQRPKKRGDGWTTEQAKLIVQRWTGSDWAPVSTRLDEGSDYLRTGWGSPRSSSARSSCCLRATSPDSCAPNRGPGRLLRTLFDVGRFAKVEDWLAGSGPRPATGSTGSGTR